MLDTFDRPQASAQRSERKPINVFAIKMADVRMPEPGSGDGIAVMGPERLWLVSAVPDASAMSLIVYFDTELMSGETFRFRAGVVNASWTNLGKDMVMRTVYNLDQQSDQWLMDKARDASFPSHTLVRIEEGPGPSVSSEPVAVPEPAPREAVPEEGTW